MSSPRWATLKALENRTRFPDIQQVAGCFNAKPVFLAPVIADQLHIPRFTAETHGIVGLWSAEVIHAIRRQPATFQALAPDREDHLLAWLRGEAPAPGSSPSVVLLDPFASARQRAIAGWGAVLDGARPRVRGYREAAERLDRAAAGRQAAIVRADRTDAPGSRRRPALEQHRRGSPSVGIEVEPVAAARWTGRGRLRQGDPPMDAHGSEVAVGGHGAESG